MKTKLTSFKNLKWLLAFAVIILFFSRSTAQTSSSSSWTVLKDTSNLTISYQYLTCGSENRVMLKFENRDTTNSSTFNWSLYFDGNIISETLSSSEIRIGSCTGTYSYLSRKVPPGFPFGDTPPLFTISF